MQNFSHFNPAAINFQTTKVSTRLLNVLQPKLKHNKPMIKDPC